MHKLVVTLETDGGHDSSSVKEEIKEEESEVVDPFDLLLMEKIDIVLLVVATTQAFDYTVRKSRSSRRLLINPVEVAVEGFFDSIVKKTLDDSFRDIISEAARARSQEWLCQWNDIMGRQVVDPLLPPWDVRFDLSREYARTRREFSDRLDWLHEKMRLLREEIVCMDVAIEDCLRKKTDLLSSEIPEGTEEQMRLVKRSLEFTDSSILAAECVKEDVTEWKRRQQAKKKERVMQIEEHLSRKRSSRVPKLKAWARNTLRSSSRVVSEAKELEDFRCSQQPDVSASLSSKDKDKTPSRLHTFAPTELDRRRWKLEDGVQYISVQIAPISSVRRSFRVTILPTKDYRMQEKERKCLFEQKEHMRDILLWRYEAEQNRNMTSCARTRSHVPTVPRRIFFLSPRVPHRIMEEKKDKWVSNHPFFGEPKLIDKVRISEEHIREMSKFLRGVLSPIKKRPMTPDEEDVKMKRKKKIRKFRGVGSLDSCEESPDPSFEKKKKFVRRVSSDFDIDNIIVPAFPGVVIREKKKMNIRTPPFRRVSSNRRDLNESSSDEDTDDEAYERIHEEYRIRERKKHLMYLECEKNQKKKASNRKKSESGNKEGVEKEDCGRDSEGVDTDKDTHMDDEAQEAEVKEDAMNVNEMSKVETNELEMKDSDDKNIDSMDVDSDESIEEQNE